MKQVHCKKKYIEVKKGIYMNDLNCNGIITGNIKVSLGCSETSAQVFLSLAIQPYHYLNTFNY